MLIMTKAQKTRTSSFTRKTKIKLNLLCNFFSRAIYAWTTATIPINEYIIDIANAKQKQLLYR